ncbi:MAG: hypothetical protein N3F05_00550 [Candidatus Diapherotrites archaeon]|nr:hypothetical protein [Candidatus Diapherotrites archaeon]
MKFSRRNALMLFLIILTMFFLIFFGTSFIGLLLGKEGWEEKVESIDEKSIINTAPEEIKAHIEIVEITLHDCNGCLNFEYLKAQLKDMDIRLDEKKIYYPDDEAKKLIGKYSIKALPTIIVRGDFKGLDIFKNWSSFGYVLNDALVFDNNIPVYYDLDSKRFVGAVRIIELVDGSCEQCKEPFELLSALTSQSGINVVDFKRIDVNTDEGKELAKKHYIDFVPSLIFSKEISDYNLGEYIGIGTFGPDGSFVVREKFPPYKDLKSGTVKGLLYVTIIEHSFCWACQGAKEMLAFLRNNLGLSFKEILVYDFNSPEAKKLIENYGISYIPAALVFGDTSEYKLFSEHWPKLGIVFKDGVYMLDDYKLLGEGYYFDLNSYQIFHYGKHEG